MLLIALLLAGCCKDEFTFVLEDGQNYAIESSLTAESVTIASGTDTTVDWSGLTLDIQGKTLDPGAEITEMQVVRFGSLTQEEILDGINTDSLKQSDVTGAVTFSPEAGDTDALLSEFKFFNVVIDPAVEVVEGLGTYLLSAKSDIYWYRSFMFFAPVVDAPVVPIVLDNESAVLALTVDLEAGGTVKAPCADTYMVDWTELTTDGYGREIDLSNLDLMMLARYTEDFSELESRFTFLEEMAAEKYTGSMESLGSLDLSALLSDDGTPFSGFEGEGTWILALRCSTCINPAPPFLAVLE